MVKKKKLFQRDEKGKLKISRGRKGHFVASYQVMTDPCCGLSVVFCGFISLLIGRETINIPKIFSGVHGFLGKTVIVITKHNFVYIMYIDWQEELLQEL